MVTIKVMDQLVQLICIKDKNNLRVRILSPGYSATANCQFPRNIRFEGRMYLVPASDISVVNSRNTFFYSVKKYNIQIIDGTDVVVAADLRVYGDTENENPECGICLENTSELMIFVPCGHYCACSECSLRISKCPMCRSGIVNRITKDQLN